MNGDRAFDHTGIIANPNCCTIPLSMALAPLQNAVGLRSVRVATYQSVSGAGGEAIEDLRGESADDHYLRMDWEFDGVEFDHGGVVSGEARGIITAFAALRGDRAGGGRAL